MEGLQFAQVLADLNGLQNTDPKAASSFLQAQSKAHKHSASLPSVTASTASLARDLTPLSTTTPPNERSETRRYDVLGRRIGLSGLVFPNSTMSSRASTPLGTPTEELDDDMARAKTLLYLYEQRDRFKQMGNTGLTRAQERVDAVAARYAKRGNQYDE